MSVRFMGPRPLGLIGMLVLVAGIESWIVRHERHFISPAMMEWQEAGRSVEIARTCTIVALGDSLVKNAVLPPAVETCLKPGQSTYNLAVSGSPTALMFFLLRRLIDSGARLEAIVVNGERLNCSPRRPPAPYPWHELASLGELADLAWSYRDPEVLVENAAKALIPSLRGRALIRSTMSSALVGKRLEQANWLGFHRANWRRNKGSHVLPDRDLPPGSEQDPSDSSRFAHLTGSWRCDPFQAAYVERSLALASTNGIRVYWLLTPNHPLLQARRTRDGWWAGYSGYLRELQTRYPNLTVIDGREAGYPPEAMADVLHLSRLGAVAMSHALGAILADSAPRSRWIVLPRYDPERARELAAESPVLDTRQFAQRMARPNRNHDVILR